MGSDKLSNFREMENLRTEIDINDFLIEINNIKIELSTKMTVKID